MLNRGTLRREFPNLYDRLKAAYRKTWFFQSKLSKLQSVQVLRAREEQRLMTSVFDDCYVVQNGPFAGMKYIDSSSCSALLPKILGSYEEPIQGWIDEVVRQKDYKTILDIGCAEGYYAIGLGRALPNTKIVAFDIEDVARKQANALMKLNDLHNVEVLAECSFEALNSRCTKNTLVFCDIEGFEQILLNPAKAPNLREADLIVESHDCFIPGMTEELVSRFTATHRIRIVVDYSFRLKKYQTPKQITVDQFDYIVDERRPAGMKFLYMESIHGRL